MCAAEVAVYIDGGVALTSKARKVLWLIWQTLAGCMAVVASAHSGDTVADRLRQQCCPAFYTTIL